MEKYQKTKNYQNALKKCTCGFVHKCILKLHLRKQHHSTLLGPKCPKAFPREYKCYVPQASKEEEGDKAVIGPSESFENAAYDGGEEDDADNDEEMAEAEPELKGVAAAGH